MTPLSTLALPVGIAVLAGVPTLLAALLLAAPTLRTARLGPGRLVLTAALPVLLGVLGVCACLAWPSIRGQAAPAMTEILVVNATWAASQVLQGTLRLAAIALLIPLLLAVLSPVRHGVSLSGPGGRGPVLSAASLVVLAGVVALIGGAFHLREGTPATATADAAIVLLAAALAAVRVLRDHTQRLAVVTVVAAILLLVSLTRWFETQAMSMQALVVVLAPEDRRADGLVLGQRLLLDLAPAVALLLAHTPLLLRRLRERPVATLLSTGGLLVGVLVVVVLLGGWLLALTDPIVGITRPTLLHHRGVPDSALPRSEYATYTGPFPPVSADLRVEVRADGVWVNEARAVDDLTPAHRLAEALARRHTTGLTSSVGIPIDIVFIAPADTPLRAVDALLAAFRRWRRQDFSVGFAVRTHRRPTVAWLPRCLGPEQDRVWLAEGTLQTVVDTLDRRSREGASFCYGGP